MLIDYCFSHKDYNHLECATNNKKVFLCQCCEHLHMDGCIQGYYKHALNIHKNHTKRKKHGKDYLDSHQDMFYSLDDDDYYDDEDDIEMRDEEVEIINIDHLFNECEAKNYLPLNCFVVRNSSTTTICDCVSEREEKGFWLNYFNSSGLWSKYPCNITYEYDKIAKIHASVQSTFHLCIILMVLFLLFLIIALIFKKIMKNFQLNQEEDEIPLVERE